MVKILIEPSGFYYYNLGDLGMLMVTIERIQQRLPNAKIFLLTLDPEKCKELFPHVVPISLKGSQIWDEIAWRRFHRWLPNSISQQSINWQYQLKKRFPKLVYHLYRTKLRLSSHKGENKQRLKALEAFFDVFINLDMYIISGQGGLTDAFEWNTKRYLNLIDQLKHLGKAIAMFGQGLGPVTSPLILHKANICLKKVDLIALREKLHGEPLLRSLKVDPHRIFVTGDDALELAYRGMKAELGHGIGINIRLAYYSHVDIDMSKNLKRVICEFSQQVNAPLLPIPINTGYDITDMQAIQLMLDDCCVDTQEYEKVYTLPQHIIEQISRCRLVITGSYHAAVFALGQGIPTIGLAASDYYSHKFLGLQDLFGAGCEVVLLHGDSRAERLLWAINYLWERAHTIRPLLIKKVRLQIQSSHNIYTAAFGMPANKSQ